MKKSQWFDVDQYGLGKVLARKGKEFCVFELVQNAWDAPGAKTVTVKLDPIPGRKKKVLLEVEDDSPEGFADLSHSYTLFKDSAKKENPLTRGRFNLGEKLVVAISDSAKITTTKGTVLFNPDGTRRKTGEHRKRGSKVTCIVSMTVQEQQQASTWARKLLPPAGIETLFNGEPIIERSAIEAMPARLKTEQANSAGFLQRVERKTEIRLFEVLSGETAMLYELGIPVVETGDRWHYDVAQKVPLTVDRENVPPSFLKEVRLAVFNHMHRELSPDDMSSSWVEQVMSECRETEVARGAAENYMRGKFGELRVAFDPNDIEANKLATSKEYTVVHGKMLSPQAWKTVKSVGAILPAGKVTPSPKPYDPDGPPLKMCANITAAMREVEQYAKHIAREVMHAQISVTFAEHPGWGFDATYSPGRLNLNVAALKPEWFNLIANRQAINCLLIHEFGHHYSADHLSASFHQALCRIGAAIAELNLPHWKAPV